MTKLQKAIKIINKRLPSSYLSEIKIFSNCSKMIRWYCNQENEDYKELLQWYDDYLTSDETNTYIKTKYWRDLEHRKSKRPVFGITAISYNPVMIAENNIKLRTVRELAFLLMHELGHHYLERKGRNNLDERWCDIFAIRWVRKMIKECLI